MNAVNPSVFLYDPTPSLATQVSSSSGNPIKKLCYRRKNSTHPGQGCLKRVGAHFFSSESRRIAGWTRNKCWFVCVCVCMWLNIVKGCARVRIQRSQITDIRAWHLSLFWVVVSFINFFLVDFFGSSIHSFPCHRVEGCLSDVCHPLGKPDSTIDQVAKHRWFEFVK